MTHVALVAALVLALCGGAFAAGGYLITSVHQISPRVVRALRGRRGLRGPRGVAGPAGPKGATGDTGKAGARGSRGATGKAGTDGTDGTNGQGPAITVTNTAGVATTSATDVAMHSVATLTVPAAGDYSATATVTAHVIGGSDEGLALCTLTARTTASGTPDVDTASASLQTTSPVVAGTETLPLQVTHAFSGAGTINLSCGQSGLIGGGALFSFSEARVVALQVSALTASAVTS
jgi:hypothetical protein